jgi:MFS family permease
MIVNVLSAFGLSLPAVEEEGIPEVVSPVTTALRTPDHSDETTPLVSGQPPTVPSTILAYSTPNNNSGLLEGSTTVPVLTIAEFLQTRSAWVLGFVLFAAVGGSEMVMSSIGSMVYSLQSADIYLQRGEEIGRDTLIIRTRQVQLIAIANTVSRLFFGIASDLLAPTRPKHRYDKAWKKQILNIRFSRLTLLLSGLALLSVTFGAASFTLNSVNQLWIISIATGLGYGLVFTLVPTLIMQAWPLQFGRNFGILNYAAALGSLCFSMLFAFVSDYIATHDTSNPDDITTATQATCKIGRQCFAPSFFAASIALAIAFFVTIPLWKAWRHAV